MLNNINLCNKIYLKLLANNQTLSIAESCTGGGLSCNITCISGISKVFMGSIVCYSTKSKIEILKVDKEIIEKYSPESKETAQMMALNVQQLFKSTWGISITGLSGPTGNEQNLKIGTVWIGIFGPQVKKVFKHEFLNVTRLKHREKTIRAALIHVDRALR